MDGEGRRKREHWLVIGLAAGALLGLIAMRLFLTPASAGHGTHEQLGLPPCALMKFTGFPCPGCGVTTAVTYAARGELGAAFATQPFGALLAIAGALALPIALIAHWRGADLSAVLTRWNRRPTWFVVGALVLASWLYKIAVTFLR